MLQFFRRHQKVFFAIVAFFIVVSFSFFGTFSAFTQGEKVSDREIGRLYDGSALKEQKFYGFLRFLQHGMEEGGRSTNLLCDSIVHKDLILSGLGEILAENLFEDLEPELAQKWQRIKSYSPYEHPFAPHINAKAIWHQMAPKINVLLDELRKAPAEFSKEQLPLLFAFYEAQADFPPPMLLQMLYYQQMQGEGVRPDPGLPNANVGLFGFQSVEDWFGQRFFEEVGTFIFNAACIAREDGYSVGREEAQVDLLQNVYKGLKLFKPENELGNEEVQQVFVNQLKYLGLSEPHAIEYWREVLLFRRLFHEVGNSVFLDRLAMQQFKNFARPSHEICKYSLPEELHFQDFWEMLKFQRYLEIAFEGDCLELPTKQRDLEQVRDQHPELVYKPFEVELGSVTKEELLAQVSLKQSWDWEGEEKNFALLQKTFSELEGKEAHNVSERMEILEGLSDRVRFQVDNFAREALLKEHPQWIEEALSRVEKNKSTLKVRLKGGNAPLSGEEFLALLETEDPALSHYSVDENVYYTLSVLEKGKGWHLLSFEEANQERTLDEKTDLLLETAHAHLEFEEPYDEVREEVGAKLYVDLLKKIANGEQWENRELYTQHRFDGWLEKMRKLAVDNFEKFEKVQSTSFWPLNVRNEKLSAEEVAIEKGAFSPVFDRQFYQLLDAKEIVVSYEEMGEAKNILQRDAQQTLMRKVLKKL